EGGEAADAPSEGTGAAVVPRLWLGIVRAEELLVVPIPERTGVAPAESWTHVTRTDVFWSVSLLTRRRIKVALVPGVTPARWTLTAAPSPPCSGVMVVSAPPTPGTFSPTLKNASRAVA